MQLAASLHRIFPPLEPPFRVTQWFGERPEIYAKYGLAGHPGVDISCVVETPFHAGMSGHVTVSQAYASGIQVYIMNAFGTLIYSHCSSLCGPPCRDVYTGEVIGFSGNTGAHTEGPHVEIKWIPNPIQYDNGYKGAVDPWPLMEVGIMDLEKILPLAKGLRWELEQAQREEEAASQLREEALKLEGKAKERRLRLISTQSGTAYELEIAAGGDTPSDWEG
jgi:hypothetical protein